MCGVGAVVSRDAAATSAALAKQLRRRGPDLFAERCVSVATESGIEIHLLAAVLAMRTPVTPQPQELTTTTLFAGDAGRSSWLVFNGEIYQIGDRCVTQGPDTPEVARIVSQALGQSVDAQTCSSLLMSMLLQLRGPWAIIVWDAARARIFFGRDPVGRRSLVTWRGQPEDDHAFGVASTAPVSAQNCEEVAPLGIYALDVSSLSGSLDYQAALSLTPWEQDSTAKPTNARRRPLTSLEEVAESALLQSAEKLTAALRDAVRLRVEFHREGALGVLFSGGLDCTVLAALAHEFLPQGEPIDLFSVCFQAPQHQSPDRRSAVESWRELRQAFPDRQWNLVCTNRCDSDILREERHILSLLEPRTTHMDFNIGAALWFAAQGSGMLACASAHDIAVGTSRDSIRASRLRELLGAPRPEKSASEKTGNGVRILEKEQQDCSLHCAGSRCRGGTHLKASCVHKACVTCCKMHQRAKPDAERCGSHKLSQDKDAARKRRRQLEFQDAGASLTSAGSQQRATLSKGENEAAQQEYTSPARILLSGLGADEQLGGYGRHRVSYTKGGWENLRSDLETDTARLWTRNLGRDDRCISDRGKEVRHPYLDENVMETLASLPLEHVVDPRLPSGDGDKRLLRIVACQLGLPGVSGLAKRAIQFGTRIAQVSRAHAPGSNRSYDASAAYVIRSESV